MPMRSPEKRRKSNRLLAYLVSALAICGSLSVFIIGCATFDSESRSRSSANASGHPGFAVYQQHCASCHGDDGQGEPTEFDEPLYGDRSLESLSRYIHRSMPDGESELVEGDDAAAVASYIYDEFYSVAARYRKGLIPRVELARLTVPQYRNAVADLILSFTPEVTQEVKVELSKEEEEALEKDEYGMVDHPTKTIEIVPGLAAQYYESQKMNKANELGIERIDAKIDFDFGTEGPGSDIAADQFSIIWQGSLFAPQTGYYEFRFRTQNGARLYLNNENLGQRKRLRDDSSAAGQAAFIDGWVSSGEMRELSNRIFLIGGRHYPLRFEFFKYLEETASIVLEWKQPRGAWQTLDRNYTSTRLSPRTYVTDTPFPADDRSFGYERGSSVSASWHEATNRAAIATATEVVNRLPLLASIDGDDSDRTETLKAFAAQFASRAFRRPLSEAERVLITDTLFDNAANPEAAVRRAVLLTLSSPHFLFADLDSPNAKADAYTVANRLALALWDSIPDQTLRKAANRGELKTRGQIEAQAWRMLEDPRAQGKMSRFFDRWLELEERELAKDEELYPEFDVTAIAALRHSLDLFLADTVWSDDSDYRKLLTADYLYLNPKLRALYAPDTLSDLTSLDLEYEGDFNPVSFPANRRAGVLTHPYLLSAFAYHNSSSPIHRGVFLTRNIVGRTLNSPPDAVEFNDDELPPDATMREKVTLITRDKACMSCHSVINPLGFALENFDAVGRWRTEENRKAIETRSEYVTEDGDILEVASAQDIARYAIENEAAHRAFLSQLFEHLVRQPPLAYGLDTLDSLRLDFELADFNMKSAMVEIATRTALHSNEALQLAQRSP